MTPTTQRDSGRGHGPESDLELDPLTERVRATWTSGDFGRIARGYERGAAEFIERLGLLAGEPVLDVACGTGNLSLPAARTGALVTGVDIAPNLIAQAQANAAREGLPVAFEVGDAERLRYADAAFRTVVSMFGAMFAPATRSGNGRAAAGHPAPGPHRHGQLDPDRLHRRDAEGDGPLRPRSRRRALAAPLGHRRGRARAARRRQHVAGPGRGGS